MSLAAYLYLAAFLFSVGVYGVLTRRNAIGVLLSVEAMANAVNINMVAFSHYYGGVDQQLFAVFVMAITVAEVVVGLALVILLYRAVHHIAVDEVNELKH